MKNYQNQNSLRHRLRTKRLQPFLSIINRVHAEKGGVRILDLGGTRAYWDLVPNEVLEEKNVYITIVNLTEASAALSIDERFKVLQGDACDNKDFNDFSFDIVHSNSVIEHVGDWKKMLQFAQEVRRLAPHYFVQTPNFWFPMEPHCMTLFFHWLPKPLRVALVRRFKLGNWNRQANISDAVHVVEGAKLLDRCMFSALFPDANINREKFMLLTKSLVAIK